MFRRWLWTVVDAQHVRGGDCGTDRCVLVAEVWWGSMGKGETQKFVVERCDLKYLNYVELNEQN
jgi:hypothetical protein